MTTAEKNAQKKYKDKFKKENPAALVSATKEYIDARNPDIEFNNDYTTIKKLQIWED